MKTPTPLSLCHNAPVTIGGQGTSAGSTHFYVCSACKKPCDTQISPETWREEYKKLDAVQILVQYIDATIVAEKKQGDTAAAFATQVLRSDYALALGQLSGFIESLLTAAKKEGAEEVQKAVRKKMSVFSQEFAETSLDQRSIFGWVQRFQEYIDQALTE